MNFSSRSLKSILFFFFPALLEINGSFQSHVSMKPPMLVLWDLHTQRVPSAFIPGRVRRRRAGAGQQDSLLCRQIAGAFDMQKTLFSAVAPEMKGKCKISNNQNLEKTILPSEKGVGGMVLIHIFETVSSSPKRPAFIFPPCFSVILREGIKRKKKKIPRP